MSVFFRRTPPRVPVPRPRRLLARDPDLPKVALIGFGVSLVLGALLWYLGSSRGADLVEVHDVVSWLAIGLLIAGLIAAIARAVMLSDLRLGAFMLAAVLGWGIGTAVAFRVTPGDTTDGEAAIVGPPPEVDLAQPTPLPTPNAATGARYGAPARCEWDPTHTTLLAIVGRRSFAVGDPPPFPARVRIDPVAGSVVVERIRLDTGVLVATYRGSFTPTTEAFGLVSIHDVVRTVAPGLDADTTVLLDLLSDLNGWYVFWDCPRFA